MADPDFLDREFTVKLEPAHAFTTILGETMKFTSWALLILIEGNKFQIKADFIFPDYPGSLSLEMDANHIFSTFNSVDHSLRFRVPDWYNRLKNSIFRNPASSMSIKKSPGSNHVHCLFGKDEQLIELGEAEFVRREPVYSREAFSYGKVAIGGVMFRLFIEKFSNKHDNGGSAVQLRITPSTLTWITPRGEFHFLVEAWGMTVAIAASFQFAVRWNSELFEMLRSAAMGCKTVELTVFDNSVDEKFYRFRFLYRSYCLSYEEQVPPQ